jgi:hypothetical protein
MLASLYSIKYIYLLSLQTTTKILLKSTLVKGFYKKGSLIIKSRLIDNHIVIGINRGFKSLYSLYLAVLFLLQESYYLITFFVCLLRFRI